MLNETICLNNMYCDNSSAEIKLILVISLLILPDRNPTIYMDFLTESEGLGLTYYCDDHDQQH